MILSDLKLRLAGKLLQLGTGVKKPFASAGNLKNITVVLDCRDEVLHAKFSGLKTFYGLDNGKFAIITCAEPDEKNPEGSNFSHADVSWTGKIKKQQLLEFFERRHTVVIGFSRSAGSALDFLIRNSNAELKIGRGENAAGIYDLEIFSRYAEPDVFIEEVKKYLKILKYNL